MPYTGPYNVYASATATPPRNAVYQMIGNANPSCATFNGPYSYNGSLYLVAQNTQLAVNPNRIWVFKSTDNGVNWVILDSANSPVRSNGVVAGALTAGCSLAGTKIKCVFCPNGATGTAATLRFQDFDLATETWGAVYGTGGPSTINVFQLFLRPSDGNYVVLHNNGATFASLRWSVVSPTGTWLSVSNDACVNLTATGRTASGSSSAVIDASGNIHFFSGSTGVGGSKYWYQAILANDTLGNFNLFSSADFDQTVQSRAESNPILSGNNIYWGVINAAGTSPSVLIGTGINGIPTWATAGPIDPSYNLDTTVPYALILDQSGINVYAAAVASTGGFTATTVRLVTCPVSNIGAASAWSVVQAFDVTNPASTFQANFALPIQNGDLSPHVLYNNVPLDYVSGPVQQTLFALIFTPAVAQVQTVINPAALPVFALPDPSKNC